MKSIFIYKRMIPMVLISLIIKEKEFSFNIKKNGFSFMFQEKWFLLLLLLLLLLKSSQYSFKNVSGYIRLIKQKQSY